MFGDNKFKLETDNYKTVLKIVNKLVLVYCRRDLTRCNVPYEIDYKNNSLIISSKNFDNIKFTNNNEKGVENMFSYKI